MFTDDANRLVDADRTVLRARISTPPRLMGCDIPPQDVLNAMMEAGLRAPDHGALRPWRILQVDRAGRDRLGALFAEAARRRDPEASAAAIEAQRAKPLRAPVILIVVACLQPEHPKIPVIEQQLSAGSVAAYMLAEAQALGWGAIWLTGANAYDRGVMDGLGLAPNEEITGFLYVGRAETPLPTKPRPALGDHFSHWDG